MFNLIHDPWIPILTRSGIRKFIRPADLTEPDDPPISQASVRPDFDGAISQWLIGAFQTLAAPESDDQWQTILINPPTRSDIERVLDRPIANAFNLIEATSPAFMQDFDPTLGGVGGDARNIGGLLLNSPGGNAAENNSALFIKIDDGLSVSLPVAAAMLATLQINAPSGGVGYRTGIRGGGPLTTLVWPEHRRDHSATTLFEKIWCNVLPVSHLAPVTTPDRRFPWLIPTRYSTKGETALDAPDAWNWCFWATPRPIRLEPPVAEGRCQLDPALPPGPLVTTYRTRNYGNNYPSDKFEHPLSPYYKVTPVDASKLPMHPGKQSLSYRDWLALAAGASASDGMDGTRFSARVVEAISGSRGRALARHFGADISIWAFGFAMDNAKVLAWREGTLPVFPELPDDNRLLLRALARQMVEAASAAHSALRTALENAQCALDSEVLYATTEEAFYAALKNASEGHDVRERWRFTLTKACLTLFESASSVSDVSGGLATGPRRLLLGLERKAQAHLELAKALRIRLTKALGLTTAPKAETEKPAKVQKKGVVK